MANATNRWLDKLAAWDKAKDGTGTDYRLAQMLGIERQRISRYRRGYDKAMGDETAVKLAELLGIHPMIVIGEIRAEQSRDLRTQRVWDQLAKAARTGGKLASVAGAVILTALHSPSASEAALQLCILC